MRAAVLLAVVFVFCAQADEVSDRGAIHRLIDAFNNHSRPSRDLFASDAPENAAEIARLTHSDSVWSEVSPPHLAVRFIRFETPGVAYVGAENVQYGSVVPVKRTPVSLVVKRERGGWRIFSVRVMPAP